MSNKIRPLSLTVTVANGDQPCAIEFAPRRTFKSGSAGYFAGGKIEVDGLRYQMSCSIVEIGSKPVEDNA